MKKIKNKGFMLAETLIVTTFVAGVLIYLYIQFSNLGNSYQESYTYNTVEGIYALEDIKNYIENDEGAVSEIKKKLGNENFIDITNCTIFTKFDYCKLLFRSENIKSILVTTNEVPEGITGYDNNFLEFIGKINKEGHQSYRIIAAFNNSTYATLRFGD